MERNLVTTDWEMHVNILLLSLFYWIQDEVLTKGLMLMAEK